MKTYKQLVLEVLDPKTKEIHAAQDQGFSHGNSSGGNKNPHDRKTHPEHHRAYEHGYDDGQSEYRATSM